MPTKKNKGKIYVGIDPGKTGGLAMLLPGSDTPKVMKMPMLTNRDYDIKAIEKFMGAAHVICIENTHTIPTMGVKAAYTFGWGAGMLYALAFVKQVPIVMVGAAVWRKTILLGTHGKDKKLMALEAMIRRWPKVDFGSMGKAEREGIVDALCLATYAMEKEK